MQRRKPWLLTGALATLALAGSGAIAGYQFLQEAEAERTGRYDFQRPDPLDDTEWLELRAPPANLDQKKKDDARRRTIAREAYYGRHSSEHVARKMRIAQRERVRWADRMPRVDPKILSGGSYLVAPPPAVTGLSWVNLGPTNSKFSWNAATYKEIDSGRVSGIAVHPDDPNLVYLAFSGGGIWKTYDFEAEHPHWYPIGDSIGNLAIGAMRMDPQDPETLYVGLGDFVDIGGGQVIKTTDGGGNWSEPVVLSGTYPAGSGGLTLTAGRIRDLRVDPNDALVVLAGTDVGLFRSADGGQSFTLVDLPNTGNPDAAGVQVPESVWSLAYTGEVAGVSHWAVSGVYACAPQMLPPRPGYGTLRRSTTPLGEECTLGNPGDVWTSQDGGLSFASSRPKRSNGTNPGRITLAVGPTAADPAQTVVFAQTGSEDDRTGAGVWRSVDGGGSWAELASNMSPRFPQCASTDVAHVQAWYNQTLVVDPEDANHVVVGGTECGMRTRSGLEASPSWQIVSYGYPGSGGGMAYVHPDWHRSLSIRLPDGRTRVLAGTDGGIFYSDDVFAVADDQRVAWRFPNRGLATHLAYSVASDEPSGDPFAVLIGLQDNGTRLRDSVESPTTFNQVHGGDGIGTAITRSGSAALYWASVNGSRIWCRPDGSNDGCNQGGAFTPAPIPSAMTCPNGEDSDPFHVRYALQQANPQPHAVLTRTYNAVYRSLDGQGWVALGSCFQSPERGHLIRNVDASPTTDGLIGAVLAGGRFAVTSDCAGNATPGPSSCTWTLSEPLGWDRNTNGTRDPSEVLFGTSSVAFPPDPSAFAGEPGDVYVAASVWPTLEDGSAVPDEVGHLFLTTDRGQSWTPLHGSGDSALPNVGIEVVRFDPSDNDVLYVGTELGVYRSNDFGATWERFGSGLPLVSVTDMFISRSGSLMRVSTYGRGVWELHPGATSRGVPGDGDWDRNHQLDFLDLAAAAARLGTTPATSSPPHYDWNLDVSGTQSAIDEDDLTHLLERFGGRP